MLKNEADSIAQKFNHSSFKCETWNDFNEPDQFYVRVFYKGFQVLIKGANMYNTKLVFVGLGDHGIGFKSFNCYVIGLTRKLLKQKIENLRLTLNTK